MIRAIQGLHGPHDAVLLNEMFQARRRLFKERLDWDVTVDERGWETDEYDRIDSVYLIAVDDANRHLGSLRLLRTSGETMLRDHFARLFDGVAIESPKIWECTRFCVEADPTKNLTSHGVQRVTAELLLGICEFSLSAGIEHIAGVFDPRMIRIYRRGGWQPEVIGESGSGRDAIYLGVWEVSEENAHSIRNAGGLPGRVIQPPSRRQDRSWAV